MKVIVITGTPASGKSTIAGKVAKLVSGAAVIRANDLVRSRHLFTSRSADGTMVADMRKLRVEIEKEIRKSGSGIMIVEGHLLCDISLKNAVAIVIREHLLTLEKRMKKRGYRDSKIKENIISEAIDYCGLTAQRNYRQVIEVINSSHAASDIAKMIKSARKMKSGEINLLPELIPFTRRKGWNA